MSYQKVRLICMFDLPTTTNQEKREYRVFRKHLIENGFKMMQYSVYYRSLPNRSALKKYEHILKRKVPRNGNIRLLYVSEKQFNDMILLAGSKSKQETVVGSNRLVII